MPPHQNHPWKTAGKRAPPATHFPSRALRSTNKTPTKTSNSVALHPTRPPVTPAKILLQTICSSMAKLLPHAFPFQPSNNGMLLNVDHSRKTSRTSSISSKDSLSLMSSRSNSTNSRSSTSSCSSSARTSSTGTLQLRRKWRLLLQGKENPTKQRRKKVKTTVVRRRRLCRRFFPVAISACIRCHALEPSNKSDVVDHLKDGNHVKLP
ncbi:hypothetical protein M0R45_014803 [Rubus argutus]|uniref:Uncharacterized protein n=1 Tax=Rubus argutus TaxID=59490 RepID=A0AAW1XNP6_RUBAR